MTDSENSSETDQSDAEDDESRPIKITAGPAKEQKYMASGTVNKIR